MYDGFLKTAERLGLVGTEAVKFANDQADREERRVERERTREESERQRQHEIEMERMRLERASVESSRASESHREAVASSKPKLPPFVDGKDDLDSYLNRFERMARSKGWEQNEWAINLSALLTGRALEVYSRLDEQESQDYEKLRDALLRRYGLTGEGYRRKLRESRPDPDESPGQFITRLSGYLLRWVDLASIDRSFQELKDLLVYEQFMEVCPKQLELYLRERVGHDLEDLAEHATKYLEAHGKSFHSLFKRHLQDNKEKGMESSSLEMAGSATTLRAEVDQRDQCMFCKYPHPSNECRKVKNLTLAERREALMRSAACFWCLRPGHRASVCRANQPRCRNCGNRHSWLLCENGVTESGLQSSPAATDATVTAASTSIEKPSQEILMQTARVKAQGEGGGALIRIMLDSGSNQTFIRSDLAKKLGCKELGNQQLNVQTFGGAHAANQPSRKVQVSLFPSDGRESRGLTLAAYGVPNICAPPPYLSQEKVKQFPHLRGLRLADSPVAGHGAAGQIDVLIGLDYLQDVVDGRMRKGTDGPIALGSRFGWILGGRSGTDVEYAGVKMTNFIRADALQELENLWTLEGIGISSEGASTSGLKEEMARAADEHFDATCQRLPDGRYENRWPWKRDPLDLPRNEDQALRRLEACERSLRRNGKLAQYDDAIQEYLDLGHAEKAPRDPNGPVHYLPHQAVYKKEKVRVVFDAAAGQPNSLNDFILPEPNLIADLSGVLLRFRLREIGVTADVEKAFLQLALHPEDRDVSRDSLPMEGSRLGPVSHGFSYDAGGFWRYCFAVPPSSDDQEAPAAVRGFRSRSSRSSPPRHLLRRSYHQCSLGR